eukprot:410041-Pelagomonas_calceolata.AAC.3
MSLVELQTFSVSCSAVLHRGIAPYAHHSCRGKQHSLHTHNLTVNNAHIPCMALAQSLELRQAGVPSRSARAVSRWISTPLCSSTRLRPTLMPALSPCMPEMQALQAHSRSSSIRGAKAKVERITDTENSLLKAPGMARVSKRVQGGWLGIGGWRVEHTQHHPPNHPFLSHSLRGVQTQRLSMRHYLESGFRNCSLG